MFTWRRRLSFGVVLSAMSGLASSAGVLPTVLNHQGVIAVRGERFTGNGAFRFALVDQDTGAYLWVNDGSAVSPPAAPLNAVMLAVVNGVYNVALGDTTLPHMTALPLTLFNGNDNLALRVWFDDQTGDGVRPLAPDVRIGTIPYAQYASVATQLNIPGTNTAAAIVDAAGEVGIGTPDPQSRLDVSGTVRASGLTVNGPVSGSGFTGWDTSAANDLTTATTFSGDVTGTFNSTVVANDSHNHGDASVDNNISINNGALFALSGSGNVGIGIAMPGGKLHVSAPAGNESVILPDSAISSKEMFDEPGVAAASASNGVTFEESYSSLLSAQITAPASGYVLATATLEVLLLVLPGGSGAFGVVGLSTSGSSLPGTQAFDFGSNYSQPTFVTIHHLFQVGAGVTTIHLVGRVVSDPDYEIVRAVHRRLTVVYLPTSYGMVAVEESVDQGVHATTDAATPRTAATSQRLGLDESNRPDAPLTAKNNPMAALGRFEERIAALERRIAELTGDERLSPPDSAPPEERAKR